MPTSVVQNHNHQVSFSAVAKKMLQEAKKGCGIKGLLLTSNHLSVADANSSKDADILARRCMQYYRIYCLWRYPHGTP